MRTASARPILIALVLAGCDSMGEKTVVSSRTSPNGSMVAENVYVDDGGGRGEGTGHLIVRNAQAKDGHDQVLGEPAPDLFMRWTDDSHLEVWREGSLGELPGLDMIGGVRVVPRSYVFPHNSTDTYRRPGLPIDTIDVPVDKVSAIFDQYSINHGKSCRLSIETAPDPSYEIAKVAITVVVIDHGNLDRPSGGVHTRFTLSNRHDVGRQTMLTSATISDIPSYNRLPEGGEGTMVRGHFLEQPAVALIESLKQPSIQIVYSRDFFDKVVRYDVPLANASKALGEFNACLGDVDLLWIQHRR
jgi:hypothetical protein